MALSSVVLVAQVDQVGGHSLAVLAVVVAALAVVELSAMTTQAQPM